MNFFVFFVWRLQTDFDALDPASADYRDPHSFYISIIRHFLNFLKEHEQFVRMALSSNLLPTLLDIFSEQIASDITEKIKIGIKKGIHVSASPEIVASFFTGAIIHTIRWWLMQKRKLSEEKLIQEVEKILIAWQLEP